MPVATKLVANPTGSVGANGVTWMVTSVALVMVNVVVPVTPLQVAEMVVTPALRPVERPRFIPPVVICATGA